VLEFHAPDFAAPIDVEAAIARTPRTATAKGMFLQKLADMGKRAAPTREEQIFAGVTTRRWVPFLDYSLRENMRLMANVVPIRFPTEPLGEGFRRYGWLAFPTFADSMAGRVMMGQRTRSDIDSILALGPKGIMMTVSHCSVRAERVEDRHWRFEYESTYCFLETYHVGILEGVLRASHVTPNIRVQMKSPSDGVFDVRW